jgi:hypothetical protein
MKHLWYALALGLTLSTSAAAQTLTDGLATCLAQHTSAADRQAMARWVFVTLASHPDLTPYASAQASQETGIHRTALHSTADGYPGYIRMGYKPVDEFTLFVPQ